MLIPPVYEFRTEAFWNFTFYCAVYNVTGFNGSEPVGVVLNVTGGPIYDTNQLSLPRENDTGIYDIFLVIGVDAPIQIYKDEYLKLIFNKCKQKYILFWAFLAVQL